MNRPTKKAYTHIIFEKVVSHVDAEIKVCPRCKIQNKGRFPEDMKGPLQYGPGIKGYVVNLLVAQMISLKRVQKMVQTLIGRLLSEASIFRVREKSGFFSKRKLHPTIGCRLSG